METIMTMKMKFAVFAALLGLSNTALAVCCWDPSPQKAHALPSTFTGPVTSVNGKDAALVIQVHGEEVPFKFAEKIGTDQQRGLLLQLKPGDKVRGTKMETTGKYHFDRVEK
jgi:hypothetical protein